ncbi:23S rRNA (uracil1939-C5)-methyltransferase [Natronobacillus azotifigens]|uniref:23S rRNA (Uracil(1939)-C(5))-methyltransferase RlmD n=1 Tax=Natronobacillus azotifigens TaxID=472978 RepID=A0A9J6RCG0_9BACI|nr:23S rRNA (uracil(1939)-C(5))-methyltransferase RlmD [Natronobacillus azotifigens]MCZ0702897.1 23S rRNA (uracil(1939)-C(5))-methyltransferase RlmD [Natronobacillus azotifigens]
MSKQQAPVKKNDIVTLNFEDITHEGNGVGKIDGYPLFVPNALPGETGQVKAIMVKKNFAIGRLLEIVERSPERVEPPCNVYFQCGGCQLQHMSYAMQLKMKQKQVESALRKIGHIDHITVESTIGMDDPWRYRNKVQIPVAEREGQLITGFYRKKSHEIIEGMDRCIITSEINDRMVEAVRSIADRLGIPAYDEQSHRGVLRHIMARTGEATDQTMIVLVTKTAELPHKQQFIDQLKETFPNITSIMQNINKERTNVILGKQTKCLWGEGYIYDTIGDIQFKISAKSFYQVNPKQTKKLYDQTLAFADLSGGETVIDAYCGIGTISLFLAQKAGKVYGVEIVPEAITDAKENAKLNKMENVDFVVGQAEKVMPWWTAQGLKPDVIVVDPPRKGCEEELLAAMIAMKPERIVYVSCNPSTLARDLRILEDGGYRTKKVQPVDMFPQTSHVECCALLTYEGK